MKVTMSNGVVLTVKDEIKEDLIENAKVMSENGGRCGEFRCRYCPLHCGPNHDCIEDGLGTDEFYNGNEPIAEGFAKEFLAQVNKQSEAQKLLSDAHDLGFYLAGDWFNGWRFKPDCVAASLCSFNLREHHANGLIDMSWIEEHADCSHDMNITEIKRATYSRNKCTMTVDGEIRLKLTNDAEISEVIAIYSRVLGLLRPLKIDHTIRLVDFGLDEDNERKFTLRTRLGDRAIKKFIHFNADVTTLLSEV